MIVLQLAILCFAITLALAWVVLRMLFWKDPRCKRRPQKPWWSSGDSSQQNEADCPSGRSSVGSGSEGVEGSNYDNSTYLPHLDLGNDGAPRDMATPEDSCESVAAGTASEYSHLRMHDFAFAFVGRSGRWWTYAIVTEKYKGEIVLVADGNGRTKVLVGGTVPCRFGW